VGGEVNRWITHAAVELSAQTLQKASPRTGGHVARPWATGQWAGVLLDRSNWHESRMGSQHRANPSLELNCATGFAGLSAGMQVGRQTVAPGSSRFT